MSVLGDNHAKKKLRPNLLTLYILMLTVLAPSALFAADMYTIDPVHSVVQFRIKHLAIANVYGNFTNFKGTLNIDPENPANNSIEAYVTTKSINTNTPKRDDHLRSPDFFDSSSFPKVSFKSQSWKQIDQNKFKVDGDLTLHGVTQPLSVELIQTGAGQDPWGGYRMGFETSFQIKRDNFQMEKMGETVGGTVFLTVSIEAVRK